MKSILLLIFLFFITISSFSQTNEIYLNDDLKTISESEFRLKERATYNLRYDLDTLIVNVKVQMYKKGEMPIEKLDSIKNSLSISSGKKVYDNTIVINYYSSSEKCRSYPSNIELRKRYHRYNRSVNKLKNVSQFFVYYKIEGTERFGNKLNWIQDRSNLITKTFFPLRFCCACHVVIDRDGKYYLTKGEHSLESLVKILRSKKKFAKYMYE